MLKATDEVAEEQCVTLLSSLEGSSSIAEAAEVVMALGRVCGGACTPRCGDNSVLVTRSLRSEAETGPTLLRLLMLTNPSRSTQHLAVSLLPHLCARLLRHGTLGSAVRAAMRAGPGAAASRLLLSLSDRLMPLLSDAEDALPDASVRLALGLDCAPVDDDKINSVVVVDEDEEVSYDKVEVSSTRAGSVWWRVLTPEEYFPGLCAAVAAESWAAVTAAQAVARGHKIGDSSDWSCWPSILHLMRRLEAGGQRSELAHAVARRCVRGLLHAAARLDGGGAQALADAVFSARVLGHALLYAAADGGAGDGVSSLEDSAAGGSSAQLARALLSGLMSQCAVVGAETSGSVVAAPAVDARPLAAAARACARGAWMGLLRYVVVERAMTRAPGCGEVVDAASLNNSLAALACGCRTCGSGSDAAVLPSFQLRLTVALQAVFGPALVAAAAHVPPGASPASLRVCGLSARASEPVRALGGSHLWLITVDGTSCSDGPGLRQSAQWLAAAVAGAIFPSVPLPGAAARAFVDFALWSALPLPGFLPVGTSGAGIVHVSETARCDDNAAVAAAAAVASAPGSSPPALPLETLAMKWADATFAVRAETNAQLSTTRALVHVLSRLPRGCLFPSLAAPSSSPQPPSPALEIALASLHALFPVLTMGVSARMDSRSPAVRGCGLRVARAVAHLMRGGEGSAAAGASAADGAPEGEQALLFDGDPDIDDAEDDDATAQLLLSDASVILSPAAAAAELRARSAAAAAAPEPRTEQSSSPAVAPATAPAIASSIASDPTTTGAAALRQVAPSPVRVSVRSYVYSGRVSAGPLPAAAAAQSPAAASLAKVSEARVARAAEAATAAAAADSAFLSRALALAARAPVDLSAAPVPDRWARGGVGSRTGGGVGSATMSEAAMAAGGDDGGAVSLVEALRSETDVEGVIATLVALPRLARAAAASPRHHESLLANSPALLRALLTLEDRFSLPDFGMWRLTALVSLAAAALPLAAQELIGALFAPGLAEGVRLEICDVLVAAVREACGADPPVLPETPWELALRLFIASRAQAVESGSGGSEESPGKSPGSALKAQISSMPPANRAAQNLLAGLAADIIFFPLIRGILAVKPEAAATAATGESGYLNASPDAIDGSAGEPLLVFAESPQLIRDASGAALLAQLLRVLAVVVECTRVHPSSAGMCRALLALAWALRAHADAGVRAAVQSCFAAVVASAFVNALLASPSALFRRRAPAQGGGGSGGGTLEPIVSSLLPPELTLHGSPAPAKAAAAAPAAADAARAVRGSSPRQPLISVVGEDTSSVVPAPLPHLRGADASTVSTALQDLRSVGWRLGAGSQAAGVLRVAAAAACDVGTAAALGATVATPRWQANALIGAPQLADRQVAAAQAALLAALTGGEATLWDDLREALLPHLRDAVASDPDAHVRSLAAAVLDNDVTRGLLLAPLEGLPGEEVAEGAFGEGEDTGPLISLV